MSQPIVVITGASTGIGLGAARELIRRGYTVYGSVRKVDDGSRLQQELGAAFHPLYFDVTDGVAVGRATAEVSRALGGAPLAGLINNAGVAVNGPIEELSIDEIKYNFEVNVFGLLRTTKAFLPLLKAGKKGEPAGRILNISSVSGKLVAPFMGPYSGTKFAVEAFSHAMRREFDRFGIKVVIIGPGPIETPIWNKANLQAFEKSVYIDSLRKFFRKFAGDASRRMSLEEFSTRMADIFENPSPRSRYTITKGKFMNFTLPTLLPDNMVDNFFKKLM
ncbi:MAG: SDR family oxidoreductase [Cyclobacteriaceae bacterium]|nr:SDR family oxidoreductase [Cyclobacteriaceae bacterium]